MDSVVVQLLTGVVTLIDASVTELFPTLIAFGATVVVLADVVVVFVLVPLVVGLETGTDASVAFVADGSLAEV